MFQFEILMFYLHDCLYSKYFHQFVEFQLLIFNFLISSIYFHFVFWLSDKSLVYCKIDFKNMEGLSVIVCIVNSWNIHGFIF